jgi:Protein of unknown function (DUF1553)/Protein of unknown function (DUF1549)
MRTLLTTILLSLALLTAVSGQQPAPSPFESAAGVSAPPRNPIDAAVFTQLARLGIPPARPCSDAVFLRRAFLDVIGTLPTADEARAFLADRSPDKRGALVDRLLERGEFADYWAMKWGDVLRIKSEFPVNLWPNAVQAYHHWLRATLHDNVPFDRVARDLLTASGSNFRVPPVNFYRAVQGRDPRAIAASVALVFMGARYETWPAGRQAAMAAFFSRIGYKSTDEWKEEIVFFDAGKGAPPTVLPDGTAVHLGFADDPREAFAAWLTSPTNPWFARAIVNRVWFWLMGRGIVQEADDIRPDNPPSNPALLAALEREFQASHFDLKRLYRLILNSRTYQLSSIPGRAGAEAEANFASALVRPLDAEVLVDAVCQVTGTVEQYSSAIPEPYTFIPPDQRSIALADGSIRSAFLDTFGRPPRDTGLLSERNSRPSASQRLYLLNSSDVQRKLQQGPKMQALIQARGDVREVATGLYLAILSRVPTDEELTAASAYVQAAGGNRRPALQDIAWALLNSTEFRFRH